MDIDEINSRQWLLTVITEVEGELVEDEDEAQLRLSSPPPSPSRDVCVAYLLGDKSLPLVTFSKEFFALHFIEDVTSTQTLA
jgi:hypothetical protein